MPIQSGYEVCKVCNGTGRRKEAGGFYEACQACGRTGFICPDGHHTPAPWTFENSGGVNCVYAKGTCGDDRRICELIGPQQDANGALLAAAPDLLNALENLLSRVDMVLYRGYVGHDLIEQCKIAIAKATEAAR